MTDYENDRDEDKQDIPFNTIPAHKLYWMADENVPTFIPETSSDAYQTWFLNREE